MRYAPIWAPDGERISFTDKNGKLWVVDVGTKQMTLVADDEQGAINAYAWSPNGGHLAFILSETVGFGSIHIWSVGEETTHKITSELFNEFDLAWDPEGNYLYYLSDREYTPQISSIEWNFATDRETSSTPWRYETMWRTPCPRKATRSRLKRTRIKRRQKKKPR